MSKHIFLSLIFVLYISLAFAETGKSIITGTVKTTDGKPAECINVALKNTYYGTITDSRGNFKFEAPVGEYTMVVYSIFAHKKEFPVTISSNASNHFPDITAMEKTSQLEEVVVTGQFSPQSLKNSVYRVKSIGKSQIEEKSATNIQSLLNTEIGIRLSNDMALGETDFEIMGMSGNNVKILIDGVPVIDRDAKKQSLSQIDINTIERIEIVEGPMSVVYGTDALAGVINIITKKTTPDGERNAWNVSARIQEESAGKEYEFFNGEGVHEESVSAGWAHKKGYYINGGFSRNISGGWKGYRTGRELQWQPKDQYLFNTSFGYKKDGLNIWYRLDAMDETIYTPLNPLTETPNQYSDRNFLTKRYTQQLQADWKVSNRINLNMATSYQDYERKTQTITTNTATGEKWLSLDESAQDVTYYNAWFARTMATWILSPKLSLQPGFEYQRDEAGGGRMHGEPDISDFSLFLSAEWKPFFWMNIRPGIRSVFNSVYDAPPAIPSLNTKFSVTDEMDLRLAYAYGFRAPALRELYFSFHNASHNIDGNPDLKAEYSHNFNASYTWRVLHNEQIRYTTTLTGFYNDFNDRITTVPDEKDPTHTTYDNEDQYKTTGGTWENTLSWKALQANLGFSYIGRYNSFSKDSTYVNQNLPQFKFSPEVTVSITYKLEKSKTNFNLFYKYTGEREEYRYSSDKKNLSLSTLESYNWMDFTINQKIWKSLVLNAGIKNIFDVTTITNTAGGGHGATGTQSFVGCGRSYFVGLSYQFNN